MKPLSSAMKRVLVRMHDEQTGHQPFQPSQLSHPAELVTARALNRRGFIEPTPGGGRWVVTDLGKERAQALGRQ